MTTVRTLTYVVKMETGDGKIKAKDFRLTLETMEQAAAGTSDQINNLSKAIGDRFGVKVKAVIDDTKTATSTMKQMAKESNRATRNFVNISRELKHTATLTGKTAKEQAELNAVYRLGAGATEEQVKEIKKLAGANFDSAAAQKKADEELKRYNATLERFAKEDAQAATQKQKEFTARTRAAAESAKRSDKVYNDLAREFKHLADLTGKTADEQQMLNAVYRLGAGATKKQIADTKKLVSEYQQLRNANHKTQGSMRAFRGQMQNVGFQLQDIAVQAQMGTNAMVILGQQGSQLAAGFGPTGALVGAGIALAGMLGSVLMPSLFDTTDHLKELREELGAVARTTGLSEAEAKLMVMNQEEIIEVSKKRVTELKNERKELKNNYEATARRLRIGQDSRKNEKRREEALKAFNKAIIQNAAEMKREERAQKNAEKAMKDYNKAIGLGLDKQEDWEKSNKQIESSITQQVAMIGLSRSAQLEHAMATDLATLKAQNANEERIRTVRLAYEEAIAVEKSAEAEREKAKELAANTKEQQRQLKILTLESKYSSEAKLELLKQQYEQEYELLGGNFEAQKARTQQYYDDRLKITGDFWDKFTVAAKESTMDFDEFAATSLENFRQNFSDSIASAIVNSEDLGDALKNVFKSATQAMISYFIELGTQYLLSKLFQGAVNQTGRVAMATAQGLQNEAMVAQASLNAFSATAAIPMIGPIMAPAAATAAGAAAQAIAAVSTGAFAASASVPEAYDKGGFIPSGGAGIVSEYGDELVGGTMVYNGTPNSLKVTGREDTARLIGGNSNTNITINSAGSASPEAIARALTRALKKPNKRLDTTIYDSMDRGRRNRGKRFA